MDGWDRPLTNVVSFVVFITWLLHINLKKKNILESSRKFFFMESADCMEMIVSENRWRQIRIVHHTNSLKMRAACHHQLLFGSPDPWPWSKNEKKEENMVGSSRKYWCVHRLLANTSLWAACVPIAPTQVYALDSGGWQVKRPRLGFHNGVNHDRPWWNSLLFSLA